MRERYARRNTPARNSMYSPFLPSTFLSDQERARAIIAWVKDCGIRPVETRRVLEVGCGAGGNLLQLIAFGFEPGNLVGNELMEDRLAAARRRLPQAVELYGGDASVLGLPEESFDVVLQFTVFTSILDAAFRRTLATKMWSLVKPGGGILWYDFMFDNPRNSDVRGIPLTAVDQLSSGLFRRHIFRRTKHRTRASQRRSWRSLFHNACDTEIC